MSTAIDVSIVPLVPNLPLPRASSAHTRASVPEGHGVQEHCLPFTAASALGFLIPSPIRFGWCHSAEVPTDARAFRSPLDRGDQSQHERVFYVVDEPRCRFHGNAFSIEGIPNHPDLREPGISFFDRDDQRDLFKLHLPYIWRTPDAIDTLFCPLVNRRVHQFEMVSGLVETDWYASPVNLVLHRPPSTVHVQAGDPIAHAILLPRHFRRPTLEIAPEHSRLARETRKGLSQWEQEHARDHQAYKHLARSRHGRIDA
jgi:hypothetical protein